MSIYSLFTKFYNNFYYDILCVYFEVLFISIILFLLFLIACQNGTYASENAYGDSTSVCIPCPDVNHITVNVPAISVNDCVCASGFITDGLKCEGNVIHACVNLHC